MTEKLKDSTIDMTLIVDRSGSMHSMQADAQGGLNSLLKEQKEVPGEARLTVVNFDTIIDIVHDNTPINEVEQIFVDPRGGTRLFDAIGQTIKLTDERLEALSDEEKPDQVLIVITTDGGDTSSSEYTKEQVSEMIKAHDSWQFVFIGADIDAFAGGAGLGVTRGSTMMAKGATIDASYSSLSRSMCDYRETGEATMDSFFKEDDSEKSKE